MYIKVHQSSPLFLLYLSLKGLAFLFSSDNNKNNNGNQDCNYEEPRPINQSSTLFLNINIVSQLQITRKIKYKWISNDSY